ncbi:PREDICTED: CTL-like protein DDB_G0274487 [Nelumbo nucifera]|uniref:Choline transporter-like protein n=1 Tax=Nelumbo nucifera TaxID=4432 RepID=A0A1U8BPP0_NELNU|nr:PREDICTED: CTL-like protein DDB_G0274487 [Nelumbo nucifera]
MGAAEPVMEEQGKENGAREEGEKENKVNRDAKETDKQEVGIQEKMVENYTQKEFHVSNLRNLNPSNPLRIVVQGGRVPNIPRGPNATRVAAPAPAQTLSTPQPPLNTLSSRAYTNRISLFLFLLHMVAAVGLVSFLGFKAVQGLLKTGDTRRKERRILEFWLPQVEGSAILSIILAFVWQKAVREWPRFMIKFIVWSSFATSLSAGILLLCFQRATTDGVGIALIGFAIGNGLYACWVAQRVGFCAKIFIKSFEPVSKFPDLNQPTYWMLGIGFMWISLWVLAVIGALNFYFPPLIIIALILSLAWTAEVMRNVANLTVSRVISLYYLRGMQSNTQFCFHRAMTLNLGSACLGSLFVPTIETMRIIARGLNLLEGEDEFMFSCAHCCLRVMESIFRYGNGWAYVQIAAYGKGFVEASEQTWEMFERQQMEPIVDSDITSAIGFLTGVCSGSICVLVTASWTWAEHKSFTATVSLMAFFIGYLLTRIGMALPHACVSCYYVCYADNPQNRLFDNTIQNRIELIKSGGDNVVPTPRVPVPRRFTV